MAKPNALVHAESLAPTILSLRAENFHTWEIAKHLSCSVGNVSQTLIRWGIKSVARHHPTAHTRALMALTDDARTAYLAAVASGEIDYLGLWLRLRPEGFTVAALPSRPPQARTAQHTPPVRPSPPFLGPSCAGCAHRAHRRYRPGLAAATFGRCSNCGTPGAVYPLIAWELAPTIPPLEPPPLPVAKMSHAQPQEREETISP